MIQIEDLHLRQGKFRLEGVSLSIPTGQYGVLMGKTGCGKTTVLEVIAGLRDVDRGAIVLAGRNVTGLSPASRGVGYVPQDGVLFKTMTVRQQLGFALDIRRASKKEWADRIAELASWLNLEHLLDRRPAGLSGGEMQRVALGRALAFHPKILLLDEPLSALDEETREQLTALLNRLRERREVTVLHVTHNRREAEALGDLVLRMEAGRVV